MAINKEIKTKYSGANTRAIILDVANERINEVGVADFRVDTVAASIGFSTGNITYHFRKREDIVNAIWDLAVDNIQNTYLRYMSSVLDIKQLYVLLRALVNENLKYVGVISYKLGDVSSISKVDFKGTPYVDFMYVEYTMIIKHLINNGYLEGKEVDKYMYLTFNTQLTLFCWWLSNEFCRVNSVDDLESIAERFAIAVIHPLTPFMTEEGLKQFMNIDRLNK